VSGTFTNVASYDLEANSQAEAIEKYKAIIGSQILEIDGIDLIYWDTTEAKDFYCHGIQELVNMVYGVKTPPLRVLGMPSKSRDVVDSPIKLPIKLRNVQVDVLGSIKSMVLLEINGETYIPTSQKGGCVDLLWDKTNDTDNIFDKFWVGEKETIAFSPIYGFFVIATTDCGKTKLGERISYIRSAIGENIYIDSADNACIELVSTDKKSIYTAWYTDNDEIKPRGLHRLTSIPIV